ncbi:peptidase M23 [Corynebacterium sp. NML140438]|uniref:M23 family metallopeptidase n=1 Tax=Corynebacterium sp. NML140438 TaxID=1906334 RepID=UPI0008FB1993|nr:M23 family metallopeptidase [Corynebacterium sp. NML140438]OIR42530.1 peptidase M23 [Corynebacterium sp. NML140438]
MHALLRWTTSLLISLCAWLSAGHALAYVDPTTGLPHATRVTRPAQIPEKNWMPGHRGVDLALRIGGPVLAADAGTVAFVGKVAGTPIISIDHPDGIRTTYQPVHARVQQGDEVTVGEVIGTLARPTGPQAHLQDGLHWGALVAKDTYINPLSLLSTPTIRLKPTR